MDKKSITTNNTVQKNFSYSKGAVSLKFSLRVDVKTELKDFAEILKVALKDVSEDLK